jgi:hypothetical protein
VPVKLAGVAVVTPEPRIPAPVATVSWIGTICAAGAPVGTVGIVMSISRFGCAPIGLKSMAAPIATRSMSMQ